MRLIYANAKYQHRSAEGGPAHMRQFIEHATALGHEIYQWHGELHPRARPVPAGRLGRIKLFRTADVVYYRIEWKPPMGAKLILPPYRKLVGNPLVAWEFNTVPEYGRVQGVPEEVLQTAIAETKRLASGVDIAFCVSNAIAGYLRRDFPIRNVVTVPNGSDPALFRPDVPPVKRIERRDDRLNVVWIGSANLAWHNFELLRDAAWSIWNGGQGSRIIFHVIGQGMSGIRDAPPNVNYYGPEQYEFLPAWLSAMHVGLNVYRPGPSDFSSPLKVFDYMASGLTVVSTEQPQAREVFEQLGQTDLLVGHDNPELLAQTLLKLDSDRPRLARQGAAGRQLVIDRYNWRRAVSDTFGELEKLIVGRS